VFDLDGTITRHDTLLPYLALGLRRYPSHLLRLWRLPAIVGGFLVDRDRGRIKGRVIHAALGGVPRAELARLTERFLDGSLARLTRPAALAAIARHRAAGDWLVLLSASTDLYVPAIGSRLGFDEVICTQLRWCGDRLDGRLESANRRGAEKTRCLEALRQRHPRARLAAYGNSAADLEHLARADAPLLVNASAAARRAARRLGVACADWN
jgi:HAD superfamily hydrolase (TIGR01490 family)